MASGLERVRLVAPSEGLDTDSAPASVKPTKALGLRNYLTGEAGRIRQRGGIEDAGQSHGVTDMRAAHAWEGKDRVLHGFRKATDTTRLVPPHRAPIKAHAISELANAYATTPNLRRVDLAVPAVDSIANVGSERSTVPGIPRTRVGKFVYGFAFDSDNDTAVSVGGSIGQNDRGGNERLTRLLRWDVSSASAPDFYYCGPYGAQDIIFHYNKLLVLGGRQPETGGDFVESNVIWFTREWSAKHHNLGFSPMDDTDSPGSKVALATFDPWAGGIPNVGAAGDCTAGGAIIGTTPMWYEDGTVAVVNRLNLPGDEADYGVGFAPVGRNLAIFKRRAIVSLNGFSRDDWSIRTAVSGVGCIDPRTIVPANEGVYFLSHQGFMFFDGVQIHDASKGVHRTIVQAGLAAVGDDAADTGFAQAQLLDREFLLLTIGTAPHGATPATPAITFCGLYNIPSNSWTEFDAAPFATTGDGPILLGRSDAKVYAADHVKTFNVPYLTTPDNQTDESKRGKDGSDVIATEWHSKVAELASPFEEVHFKRLIVDYEWAVDGSAGDALASFDPDAVVTTRPKVELRDGEGVLIKTFYLPAGADPSVSAGDEETYRQRFVYDFFADVAVSEVQVRIEYTGAATALVKNAIHDVWIEFTRAQERRNA